MFHGHRSSTCTRSTLADQGCIQDSVALGQGTGLREELGDPPGPIEAATVHWDGTNIVSSWSAPNGHTDHISTEIQLPRDITLSACQARCRPPPERRAKQRTVAHSRCTMPIIPSVAADYEKLAEIFSFLCDPRLLRGPLNGFPIVIGELGWISGEEKIGSATVAARPVLIVHAGHLPLQANRIEVIPHLSDYDPLLHHIALVVRAGLEAKAADDHLFAESLGDALALHFLRRYAARPAVCQLSRGLPTYKLQRVIAYIKEHLDQDLSLTTLAIAAQTSVAHFARSFKCTTGSSPHRYVLLHRIEHAKRLLTETDLPLSEVAQRVGLADQSHLTALFRIHVGNTPKAYRDSTKNS